MYQNMIMLKEKEKLSKDQIKGLVKKELESQRKSYCTNFYHKNYKKKCYEKQKEKKYYSKLNHAKVYEAIKYGPIFICECCQARKNMKLEVFKDSIDFNEEHMDPLKLNNDYLSQSCHQIMSKSMSMQKLSIQNGLFVEKFPHNYN